MRTRSVLSLIIAASVLSAPAYADPAADAAKKAAEQAAAEAAKNAADEAGKAAEAARKAAEDAARAKGEPMPGAAVPVPPQPAGIPVPDGPVVKKTELEGGLIAEDIVVGEGFEVKDGGSVVAHYHGTLKADPTKVFDSSFQRGEPVAFPLSGVIPGWQKGVPGMKIGGVRRLIIPAALAYGAASPSPDIPANSDLVFVIKLVDAIQSVDDKIGDGEAATGQCVAVVNHVIKDADGKELENAKMAIWFPGEPPVSVGLEGMKVGGKRTIKVPKDFNRANPMAPSTRPTGVALTCEVELIAVRNLQPRGAR